jgi:hypothetical protein
MNYLFIIVPAILISIVLIYIALNRALDVKIREEEEESKFEPRKVTDLSIGKMDVDPYEQEPPPLVVTPKKKKYYKKRPKKSE